MFTKGQEVTLLQDWDRKGTVRIAELTVHSCGKKQMILTDCSGDKFEGQFFFPTGTDGRNYRIVARLSAEAAEAAAIEMGADVAKVEREAMERAIAHCGHPESHGYTKAVRAEIAEIHEPRVIRYERKW